MRTSSSSAAAPRSELSSSPPEKELMMVPLLFLVFAFVALGCVIVGGNDNGNGNDLPGPHQRGGGGDSASISKESSAVTTKEEGDVLGGITDSIFPPNPKQERDEHILPTLLKVRRAEDGAFVHAHLNPLYALLKERLSPSPLVADEGVAAAPLLWVDRREVSFREPLAVTWLEKGGRGSKDHDNGAGDDDVIALYCPADEVDPRKFRDAATVAQARAMGVRMEIAGSETRLEKAKAKAASDGGNSFLSSEFDGATQAQRRLRSGPDHTSVEVGEISSSLGDIGGSRSSWLIRAFPVVREDTCEFRLWSHPAGDAGDKNGHREDDENYAMVLRARTGPVAIRGAKDTPTAVHLALTENPHEMRVQFTTGASTGPDGQHADGRGTPVVGYGEATSSGEADLTLKAEGSSLTYAASDMCMAPANETDPGKFVDPGMLHSVVLKDLKPDTDYRYRPGITGGQGIVWSSESYLFRSPPDVDAPPYPYSYVVYGDQGCTESQIAQPNGGSMVEALLEREVLHPTAHPNGTGPIRAIHHFGDLSYALGAGHVWEAWLDMIQNVTSRVPLMIGVGNHEYDHTAGGDGGKDPSGLSTPGGYSPTWGNFGDDSGGECGVPTAARFTMPDSGGGNNGVFWYSYDMASTHVVMLSSEHDLSPSSAQYAWLESDLKSVNRTRTPWLVLEMHRPMYESEKSPQDLVVGEAMRSELEGLLKQYEVDLVLAGHYHSYLRTCPGLFKGECNSGGPIHITVGTAGADHWPLSLYAQNWTDVYLTELGYGRVTVANATAMLFEFISVEGGWVHDHVWLLK